MSGIHIGALRVAVTVGMLVGSSYAAAFTTYSSDGETGNCADCHGDYRAGSYESKSDGSPWNDSLMGGHRNFINDSGNDQCDVCHSGSNRSPVVLNLSDLSAKPKGCVGCHGRDGDGPGQIGDGLRAHHMGSNDYLNWPGGIPGGLTCAICHGGDTTPVGEDILPFNYSVAGTIGDPCVAENQFGPTGLDNDGDGAYDAADSDCTPVVPTPGDLNFDGKADILWRNSSTGQNWVYLMNADQIDQSLGINTVSTAWQIVGNGDYDNDDDADILWRNSSTGENWMYLMDGALIDSSERVISVPTEWQVAGNGDYDGDGDADILWRNSVTGQNWMYLMNGSVVETSMVVVWDSVFTIPTVWQVAGNGDYNGDNRSDILWRHSSTGENWIYFMNGATVTNSVRVNTVPTTWQLAGNGDYDGDGDADILWRNTSTGQNWMYLMNGATIDSSVGVNTVPTDWEVAGNGDYNGDLRSDILWRRTGFGGVGGDGRNWMYLMNGATVDSSVGVNTVPTDWDIVNVD